MRRAGTARIGKMLDHPRAWLFAVVVLVSAFVLQVPAVHASNCAGPDPLTATTFAGLDDIINTGGACTAANGDTVTIAPGLYAPTRPLTVSQTNLTVQGPASGDGVVILGSDNQAGTQDIFDVQ